MLTLITGAPQGRIIPGVEAVSAKFVSEPTPGQAVLAEPVFLDFRGAGNNELGFPFLMGTALGPLFPRMHLAFTYTAANAAIFKGYILDVVAHLKQWYPVVEAQHLPYAACGAPVQGSTLVVHAGSIKFTPKTVSKPVMPSEAFPGLLSHVTLNRPNYPTMVTARSIGAVRSDLNLLPPVNFWGGRTLMVEYREGNTLKLQRMKAEHIGMLFGCEPRLYTDNLAMALPAEVVAAFV